MSGVWKVRFIIGIVLVLLIFPGSFITGTGDSREIAIPESPGQDTGIQEYAFGFVLVKSSARDGTNPPMLASAHASIGATVVKDYTSEGIPGLELVNLPDALPVPEAITYYQKEIEMAPGQDMSYSDLVYLYADSGRRRQDDHDRRTGRRAS